MRKLVTDEGIAISGNGSDDFLLTVKGRLGMVVKTVAVAMVLATIAWTVLAAVVVTVVIVVLEVTPLGAWWSIVGGGLEEFGVVFIKN